MSGRPTTRALLSTPGGSVTEFSFSAETGLAEHATPHEALVTVLDGTVRVTLAGETHDLGAGATLHLPAGVRHDVHAAEPARMLLTILRTDVRRP